MPERIETIIENERKRGNQLYSSQTPNIRGAFVLSQKEAAALPIDVGTMYQLVDEEVRRNPARAYTYAQTFGMTSISLTLDTRETFFEFEQIGDYPTSPRAEVRTTPTRTIGQIVTAQEIDSPVTYLLAETGNPQTVEMSLIQALHMVDTAIMTGKYVGAPLVRLAELDELFALKEKLPDLFLRPYGNVRKLSHTPAILGCVIETALLESSGIQSLPLTVSAVTPQNATLANIQDGEREPAAFIGITTTKRPHIGHGFLLTKAIADSPSRAVIVELNDQGPRVDQMVAKLAENLGIELEETLALLESGAIDLDEVEPAYQQRDKTTSPFIEKSYTLKSCNEYFSKLLEAIRPENTTLIPIADSDTNVMQVSLPGLQELFSGSGMSTVCDPSGKAMVIEAAGKKTLPGIITASCKKFILTLVDSPSPLTKAEFSILRSNGIEISRERGTGVLIDFAVSSGTEGGTLLLQDIIATTEDPTLLPAALRLLMDDAYFFYGEGDSLLPNFASNEILNKKIAEMLNDSRLALINLERPMKFIDVRKELAFDLLKLPKESSRTQKITAQELLQLVEKLPGLEKVLSIELLSFLASAEKAATIPKNYLTANDRNILQQLKRGDLATIIGFMLQITSQDLLCRLKGSKLEDALTTMGYQQNQYAEALERIMKVEGIFKII